MEEQEPTMVSPAALAETGVVETEPTAWSDTDEIEEPAPHDDSRRNWLISGVIFAATAAVAGLAAGGAYVFIHEPQSGLPAASSTTTASLAAAPPPVIVAVTPNPMNYDQALLDRLTAKGWKIANFDKVIGAARITCNLLRKGNSPAHAAQLYAEATANTPDDSEAFVETVMAVYPNCP